MHIGHYISGLAHSGFLFWAILGGLFEPKEPPPVDVVNVAVVSMAEYAAMIMTDVPPEAEVSLENIPIPSLQMEELPDQPIAEEAVDTALDPDQMEPYSKPDEVPQTPDPLVVHRPELEDKLPDMDTPSSETLALLQSPNKIEAPQKTDRIAPMAVAPSVPDIQIDEQVQEAALPSEIIKSPEQPKPEEIPEPKETAEPEAATEITPEIQKELPTAPKISLRPKARPPPKPQPKLIVEPEPESNNQDAINAALKTALEEPASPTQAKKVLSSLPITASEKDGLRLSVKKCWVVDAGNQSANVTVTISMNMNNDGTVKYDTLVLKNSEGGSKDATKAAFEAARRAILRCQKTGYDLPKEKYERWQEIEITFDPRKMRIR